MSALTQSTLLGAKVVVSKAAVAKRTNVVTRAGQYDDELLQTAVSFFSFFFTLMCVCFLLPLKKNRALIFPRFGEGRGSRRSRFARI